MFAVMIYTHGMSKLNQYLEDVRVMYLAQKMSDAEVAKALPIDVSAQTVARFRANNNIKGHRRGAKSALDQYEAEIRRMYVEERLSDQEIAAALPIAISTEAVRGKRTRMGIVTDRNKAAGRFSREAQFEQIKDELPAAWERSKRWHSRQKRMMGSAQRVGEEFGVGMSTAQKWLARVGLTEERSVHDEDAPSRALELFESGLSVPAIEKQIGVPGATLRTWLATQGVDLSAEHFTKRMSEEEHRAWRDSIRIARAPAEVINGRFNYRGTSMDSTYEVRLAKHCDQIGVLWERYDRTTEGALVEHGDGALYGPDFVIGGIHVETKGYYTPKDQAKVRAWREIKGDLALVTHVELADFERIVNVDEAMAFLEACFYNDPVPESDRADRDVTSIGTLETT